MSVEFTEEWLRSYCKRTGQQLPSGLKEANAPAKKSHSKYRNHKTDRDGRTFASQHEADIYDELMLCVKAGELYGVFCQHPFRLPGDVVYFADFVVLNRDGTYTVIDAKSVATEKDKTYRLKRRQMKNCLGITIKEV